jgi:hypothetical protein
VMIFTVSMQLIRGNIIETVVLYDFLIVLSILIKHKSIKKII